MFGASRTTFSSGLVVGDHLRNTCFYQPPRHVLNTNIHHLINLLNPTISEKCLYSRNYTTMNCRTLPIKNGRCLQFKWTQSTQNFNNCCNLLRTFVYTQKGYCRTQRLHMCMQSMQRAYMCTPSSQRAYMCTQSSQRASMCTQRTQKAYMCTQSTQYEPLLEELTRRREEASRSIMVQVRGTQGNGNSEIHGKRCIFLI